MQLHPYRLALLMSCGLTAACGTSEPENQPPRWTDAPTEVVVLHQGVERAIPFSILDPDQDDAAEAAGQQLPQGLSTRSMDGQLWLRADYNIVGAHQMEITLTDGEVTVPVTVDLEVRPLGWQPPITWQDGAGPEVREHTVAFVDEASRQSYVFFGSGYSPQFEQMLDDVWRLDHDTNSWTQVTPTGDVPSGRGSMRLAAARGSHVGYLWGGYGAPTIEHDELYRVSIVDGTLSFKLLTQVNTPPARALHGFVYDAQTDTFAMFGGVGNGIYGDTWTMKLDGDTATWTEHNLPVSPSERYGFFYGFDEELGRMLLFSGAQLPVNGNLINAAHDVWELSLRSDPPVWSQIGLGSDLPEGRRNGSFAWDQDGRRLFIWGGTADGMTTSPGLFVFDARPEEEAFVPLALPAEPLVRSSGLGFYDGERILMGFGNGPAPQQDLQPLGY